MVSPIFVVGAQRTGTTWLANILCNHSNVAGIQGGIKQEGIHESAFFSHLAGKYGDLRDPNNLVQFIEVFVNSDHFIQSGLDKEIFYSGRPRTYQAAFQIFMECFAKKQAADYYIEKTPAHSLHLMEISNYYKQAKFIAISRRTIDQIKSISRRDRLTKGKQSGGLGKMLLHIRRIIVYHTYYKHIKQLMSKQPDRIMLIKYEDLKNSTKETVIRVCEFLGIDFQAGMLEQRYRVNTSFINNAERNDVLSVAEERLIKVLNPLFEVLPYALYHLGYKIKRKLGGGGRRKLPPWFFFSLREQYGLTYNADDNWKRYKSQLKG